MTLNEIKEYKKISQCYSLSSSIYPSVINKLCEKCFKKQVFELDFVKRHLSDLTETHLNYQKRLKDSMKQIQGTIANLTRENTISFEITPPLPKKNSLATDLQISKTIQENYTKHMKALKTTTDFSKILNQNIESDSQKQLTDEISLPFMNCDQLREQINLKTNSIIEMTLIEQKMLVLDTLEELDLKFKNRIQQIQLFKEKFVQLNHQSDTSLVQPHICKSQTINSKNILNDAAHYLENSPSHLSNPDEERDAYESNEFVQLQKMNQAPLLAFEEYFTRGFDIEIMRLNYDKFCEFHKQYAKDINNQVIDKQE
eukprot:403369707